MTTPKATISIVIPNHNHAEELRYSLRAITHQTRPADEVLVIDDGSTDDSLEVINEFARENPSLRLMRNDERQGVVFTVNRGILAAKSEFIILASADEKIMPDMCEMMEKAFHAFPDASLYASKFTEWQQRTALLDHGKRGEYDFWFTNGTEPEWVSAEKLHALLKIDHLRLSANSAMFRKKAMLEVGMLDPGLRWYSDFFLTYVVALRHGFCAVPRSLSWFQVADGTYSSRGSANRTLQQSVTEHFLKKLETEDYSNIRAKFFSAPAAMSAFIRPLLVNMLLKPSRWGLLLRLALWWFKDALRGKRPGLWANTKVAGVLRQRHIETALLVLNQKR